MERKDLIHALKNVLPGVDKQEESLLAGTDSFIFDYDWVRSFNDAASVSFPLKSGVKAIVKAQAMYKVLQKMKGEELTFERPPKKDYLKVSDGTTYLELATVEAPDPLTAALSSIDLNHMEWKKVPKDFMRGITFCTLSMSRDKALSFIRGMAFTNDTILSTDNYRVSKYIMEGSFESEFTLPRSFVTDLVNLDDVLLEWGPLEVEEQNWIHFKAQSGAVYSSRTMLDEFPVDRAKGLFDQLKEDGKKTLTFPEGIEESIDRIGIMSHDSDGIPCITLSVKGNDLIISGNKEGVGKAYEKVPWQDASEFGTDKEIDLSPLFLRGIIKFSREFSIFEDVVLFKTDNFQHVLALGTKKGK